MKQSQICLLQVQGSRVQCQRELFSKIDLILQPPARKINHLNDFETDVPYKSKAAELMTGARLVRHSAVRSVACMMRCKCSKHARSEVH
jgi:hypothetical protein